MTDQNDREREAREAEERRIEKAARDAEERRKEAEERSRKARDDDDPFKTERRIRR